MGLFREICSEMKQHGDLQPVPWDPYLPSLRRHHLRHYMAGAAIGEIMQLWERRLATLQPVKLEDSEHVAERLGNSGGDEFPAG